MEMSGWPGWLQMLYVVGIPTLFALWTVTRIVRSMSMIWSLANTGFFIVTAFAAKSALGGDSWLWIWYIAMVLIVCQAIFFQNKDDQGAFG